ncbi:hypothetical protein HPULCUR_007934 [Helicostylum pulchrum]|uniref:BUB1 N-terminal domain-containing protein n=1 Tax=Helicostylum pulchrum TaxID=562976 RepID=A0ABP9Y667_9FUNG
MDSNYIMTSEERRSLIDSIPEASIIDGCKENIQPRRQGRSASSLTRVFGLSSSEREQAIEQGQRRFLEQLEKLEELDDPLDVYIQHVAWTIEMFPEGSVEYDLMTVLHDATNKFKNDPLYKQDPRYLKLWMEYSKWVEEPIEIFEFLIKNEIGKKLALFYEEYASYFESLQKYDKALEAYRMGMQIEARPIQRLTRNYCNLEARIDEIRRRGLIKKREQEARIQMNELKSNKRTMLGHKFDARSRTSVSANVYAGIQSTHGSTSRTTSFGNDRFSIPASSSSSISSSNSKIAVFQDDPSSSHHRSPSSPSILSPSSSSFSTRSLFHKSSSPSTQKFQPSISTSSASENRITAEKFSGAIIPQAEIVRPVVESFSVYRDSEEETPRRRFERSNSSMLSEASGEESLVSKIRKHPTQDIEPSKRSRLDAKSEIERDHAKKMEDHFKKNRRFYLRNKDSQEREETLTVLKTTHVSTSFEEERALSMGIPFTVRDANEESTGFEQHYSLRKPEQVEVGYTTETRNAVESIRELVYGDTTYTEDEKDLTWTNPIQRFKRPDPSMRKKPANENN